MSYLKLDEVHYKISEVAFVAGITRINKLHMVTNNLRTCYYLVCLYKNISSLHGYFQLSKHKKFLGRPYKNNQIPL